MADIELEEAIERSARNRASRWPERGVKNRLEPECWPELTPRFDFAAGARVFTIGSCFARNVELHLASLGFDIPTRKFLNENRRDGRAGGDEILNKYTPPSIIRNSPGPGASASATASSARRTWSLCCSISATARSSTCSTV